METKRLLKYSMQLAMLGQLLARGKITEMEYRKIMQRLKKDYGIVSLSRRTWHSSSKYSKIIWSCVTGTKKGKKFCPDSKGIPEKVIEDAFIESYKLLCGDNKEVLEEFIERVEASLSESNIEKSIEKIDREVIAIKNKKKKLLDMRLDDKIDQLTYDGKLLELSEKIKNLLADRQDYLMKQEDEKISKEEQKSLSIFSKRIRCLRNLTGEYLRV